MKVLITGGDGFVGEHLIHELLEAGHHITASALSLPPDRNTISSAEASAVDWKLADVLDRGALYRLVAAVQPEWIFHLAGFASGARAREEPEQAVRVNAGGTVNLMEAILAGRQDFPELDPRVVVLGSGEAYGDAAPEGQPATEDMSLRAVSVYGLSKACQELTAHTYRRARGLRTVVARPFHLIGPGQKAEFVLPSFCAQAAAIAAGRAEPLIRVGNLSVERDFMDVRDGVRALVALMGLARPEAAYNVCSGRALAIRRLLEWVLDEAGVEVEVRTEPERVREDEPARALGDPGRIQRDTGWMPEREVEETVRETYRWYIQSRGA